MNIQAAIVLFGIIEGFTAKYRERLEKNGKVDKSEIDDILKEVIIETIPGGSLLLSLAEGLKDLVDGEE